MPTATLFYLPVLVSVILSSLIQIAFQIFFFLDIRKRPFYVPLDISTLDFVIPNPCYEQTVLFFIANFQYLITCMAFSIAKPFRKPIYTNKAYFACVIALFLFNTLLVYLPADNSVASEFNLEPFQTKDGTSYYSYKYWIGFGILANSIMTYAVEKLVINVLTRSYDEKMKRKRSMAFQR